MTYGIIHTDRCYTLQSLADVLGLPDTGPIEEAIEAGHLAAASVAGVVMVSGLHWLQFVERAAE